VQRPKGPWSSDATLFVSAPSQKQQDRRTSLAEGGYSGEALMARPAHAAVGAASTPARASSLRHSPLCFFRPVSNQPKPSCARSENTGGQTLTLTCQRRRRSARRACLSSIGACWHSPGKSPGVQDRAAWMKYGPLQFCFAQKRLFCWCCALLLKHPSPIITTVSVFCER
jgi:hypothetical protein